MNEIDDAAGTTRASAGQSATAQRGARLAAQLEAGTNRLLLIGGLHRSGTTLFGRCLAAHPDATGFEDTGVIEDEGQFLQPVYPPAREFGGPGRFGWDERAHLDGESELAGAPQRDLVLGSWAAHWDLTRRVWIEKSPPNLIKSRYLQALFPSAAQVMVLRHPVASALATEKWARGTSLERLIAHWVHCHTLFRRDLEHLPRAAVLSYESFVHAPGAALELAQRLVNLSPHPADLEVRAGLNERYFERFRERARGWLSRHSIRRLVRSHEQAVRDLGYSLEDLERDAVAEAWGPSRARVLTPGASGPP